MSQTSEASRCGGMLSRRDFLVGGAALVGLAGAGRAAAPRAKDGITIGIYTDSHYADRKPAGNRHYRDSAAKLTEFVKTMNEAKPDFCIVLGDFVDKGKTLDIERGYLRHIEGIYGKFTGRRYHVIGNHDVATFSKEQFVDSAKMPAPHHSFDVGAFHCVVLDANYRKDFSHYKAGNFNWTQTYVPPNEQKWLAADLAATKKKTVVFIHQTLDDEKGSHGVKNAPQVRRVLEKSGKVLAVFQGHNHGGAYRKINGIEYFTMRAMVTGGGLKNNAHSIATITPESIKIRGFGRQSSRPA